MSRSKMTSEIQNTVSAISHDAVCSMQVSHRLDRCLSQPGEYYNVSCIIINKCLEAIAAIMSLYNYFIVCINNVLPPNVCYLY